MQSESIHPTAIIGDSAVIGEGTRVGPYAIIEDGVCVGSDCRIAASAILRKGTILGDGVSIDSFAVIGGDPQALSFDTSLKSGVRVGKGVRIREGATIHRAMMEGAETVVGDGCYLMAQSHVGHDSVVGENVILCNAVLLGGHVEVGERAFLGGGAGVHQFCRVGSYSMMAGNSTATFDVPPYVMAAGWNSAHGLNLVGLRRASFTQDEISDLKRCYRAVLFGGGNLKRKAAEAVAGGNCGITVPGARFLAFFDSSKRGFIASQRDS